MAQKIYLENTRLVVQLQNATYGSESIENGQRSCAAKTLLAMPLKRWIPTVYHLYWGYI